ncbi:MAG: potassium transporter Kup, partial [Bdellovibrionota bacterium]
MTTTAGTVATPIPTAAGKPHAHIRHASILKLGIGAMGVVYGDIGTSPLYAVQACFDSAFGLAPTPTNVFGILSLIFWALTLVVTVKYLLFILRADNEGEGGILALLALLSSKLKRGPGEKAAFIVFLGLFGAALLYGDGVITPAISVLSAVEGLQVATPAFQPVVVPLTIAILFLLFWVQSRGTTKIGAIFGPATLVWFGAITLMGLPWIIRHPEILGAVNPLHAVRFFLENKIKGFLVLSSVVLCITGGEALYADMGHFGRAPIRFCWFTIVLPSLLINYFGQGAIILERGAKVLENPFYAMVDGWMLYPMVVISTVATVIASQALISGAYSLTQQAIQLGYLPRMNITHTSRETEGQIYMPGVNTFLMIGCIAIVIAFRESSKLATAYGMAVTGTMLVTSLLFYGVARRLWNWSRWAAGGLVGLFLTVELAFFFANLTKIHHGGWIPIAIAIGIFIVMTTWKAGRLILTHQTLSHSMSLTEFVSEVGTKHPKRVKGTAIFMALNRDVAPSVLLHHFKHNQVLHEKVILVSIVTEHSPEVQSPQKASVTDLGHGFYKIIAHYGFMEHPDVTKLLHHCEQDGLKIHLEDASFYLGRETLILSGKSGMPRWRKRLFLLLSRNA